MSKGCNGKGKVRFRKLCSTHWKLKQGEIHNIDTSECNLCKWKGPCDKHRIVMGRDGGRYKRGNVMVLCPNCHRLVHTGGITLK